MQDLKELIWFAIPGGLLTISLCLVFPNIMAINPVLIIGLAVILGFIVHQVCRLVIEISWESTGRPVINEICKSGDYTPKQAFLIWEITFYSENVEAVFRDHDRGAWQYVKCFWTTASAAALGGMIALIALFISTMIEPAAPTWLWPLWMLISTALALLFFQIASLTERSIGRQELAYYHLHREKFHATANQCIPTNDTDRDK